MIDLAKTRQVLEGRILERIAQAEKFENRLRQPGNRDWEEQATELENNDVLLSLSNQTIKEIEQINQALRRIDAGKYGSCLKCGREIPPERLEVLPEATTCMQCG